MPPINRTLFFWASALAADVKTVVVKEVSKRAPQIHVKLAGVLTILPGTPGQLSPVDDHKDHDARLAFVVRASSVVYLL